MVLKSIVVYNMLRLHIPDSFTSIRDPSVSMSSSFKKFASYSTTDKIVTSQDYHNGIPQSHIATS